MSTLFLDTETYCETPIANGTHAYAEDAEIMVVALAVDDDPVQVWEIKPETAKSQFYSLANMVDTADEIVMHNSGFDRTVLRHAAGIDIPAHKIHDTMVQAMAHGLPGGLDKLCSIMNVPADLRKHDGGKDLIRIFCKPQPKNQKIRRRTALTDPKKWQEFLDYAGGDILSMRWLRKQLPAWNYQRGANTGEHALWVLDQKINDRGFLVDSVLARGAIDAVAKAKADADARTQEMTGGEMRSTTQRDKLLQELLFNYGVALPDTKADTIERRLEDPELPDAVKELLANRLMVSSTSIAKFNKMLKAVSSDGRLRGTLQFCGAPRTKRWAGRVFQPQNLPRPDMSAEEIAEAIEAFRLGVGYEMLEDPMRAAWNVLRGLIVAPEGKKIVQADLSGIEARVLPWLAGEEWKLQVWRDKDAGTGPDVYKATAARLLGIDPADVTGKQRQSHGKVVELACGYGGAAGAFAQFAALYKVDMSDSEVYAAVRGWRDAHPAIADWSDGLWAQLDRAAREAIASPGKVIAAGEHIHFEKWRSWLKMHLPSGGYLSYASPKIIPDEKFGGDTLSFMGIDNYTRRWKRITTYGGKLSADATQSTARDILAYNLPWIDEKYPIILQVHDEVVTEVDDTGEYSVEDLASRIARRPYWVDDKLPLAAGGFEDYRYKKDD